MGSWLVTRVDLIAVAILEDLEEMMASVGVERFQTPVIEDEQIDAREAFQPDRDTTITARHTQFVKQLAEPDVEDR